MNDQLKADILRRAAELSDEEDENETSGPKSADLSDVEGELDTDGALRGPGKIVAGDVDSSEDEDEDAVRSKNLWLKTFH